MEKQRIECPKCKEKIIEGATLCRYCGSKIGGQSSKNLIIGFLALCLSIALFFIVLANTNSGSDFLGSKKQSVSEFSSKQGSLKSSSAKTPSTTASKNISSEKKLDLGIDFLVLSHEKSESIGKYSNEKPQGVFYIFKLEIENNNKTPKYINPTDFNLVDSRGRKYSYDQDASMRLSFDESVQDLSFETIQPGLSLVRYIVFDIPRDASGLSLVTRDGKSKFVSDKY